MLDITKLKLKSKVSLTNRGESYLLGVSLKGRIFAEEFYDEAYIAQYEISSAGDILKVVDEDFGQKAITLLNLPDNMIEPSHPLNHPLNHGGLRYRGLREAEKVMEWVKPLSMIEKMPLLKALNLKISPMMIFGIAESRVLSQVFVDDTTQIVCRRIRLLHALAEMQYSKDGIPYDYDMITFSLLHPYDTETGDYPLLHEAIHNFSELQNPQDCIYADKRLIVSTNSDGKKPSEIYIYDEIEPQE